MQVTDFLPSQLFSIIRCFLELFKNYFLVEQEKMLSLKS